MNYVYTIRLPKYKDYKFEFVTKTQFLSSRNYKIHTYKYTFLRICFYNCFKRTRKTWTLILSADCIINEKYIISDYHNVFKKMFNNIFPGKSLRNQDCLKLIQSFLRSSQVFEVGIYARNNNLRRLHHENF